MDANQKKSFRQPMSVGPRVCADRRAERYRSPVYLKINGMYNELATEITREMVKPQRFRQDADVFLQRIMDRFNYLNNLAPST